MNKNQYVFKKIKSVSEILSDAIDAILKEIDSLSEPAIKATEVHYRLVHNNKNYLQLPIISTLKTKVTNFELPITNKFFDGYISNLSIKQLINYKFSSAYRRYGFINNYYLIKKNLLTELI